MFDLVNYSDTDTSSDSSSTNLSLSNPFRSQIDANRNQFKDEVQHVENKDFFNLNIHDNNKFYCPSNLNFWTSTINDDDILPDGKNLTNIEVDKGDNIVSQQNIKPKHFYPQVDKKSNKLYNIIYNNSSLKYSINYVISHETADIVQPSSEIIIYPRIILNWPFLLISGPFYQLPLTQHHNFNEKSGIFLWKLSLSSKPKLVAIYSNKNSNFHNIYCWSTFKTNNLIHLQDTEIISVTNQGLIEIWNINQCRITRCIDVSKYCGPVLKCATYLKSNKPDQFDDNTTSDNSDNLLIGGINGLISLWDVRVNNTCSKPNLKFHHNEITASISDILWLTNNEFASSSDTVDRNSSEHNITVWDIRYSKPVSHQLYQERWGCGKMTLKSCSERNVRFAVQTQSDSIVEIYGKYSNKQNDKFQYRLDRHLRYEGHKTHAHPLGLAYNSNRTYLASGTAYSSGPVIWPTKSPNSQPIFLQGLSSTSSSNNSLITDVLWVPKSILNNIEQNLIAIQSNADIIVYNIKD